MPPKTKHLPSEFPNNARVCVFFNILLNVICLAVTFSISLDILDMYCTCSALHMKSDYNGHIVQTSH